MITPQDIHNTDTNMVDNQLEQFRMELDIAESKAIKDFKKLRLLKNPVKYIKIKLNGDYPESLIKKTVQEYRDAGWSDVQCYQNDKFPGSREPMLEWVIKIKFLDNE